jgi:hypothetical protein
MDFIERLFHVSPDGGNGSLEALLWLVPVVLAGIVVCWLQGMRRPAVSTTDGTSRNNSRPAA